RPAGVRRIAALSCRQMQRALEKNFRWCDCLVMSAAVGDFRARKIAPGKIKRSNKKRLKLELVQNPDILRLFGRKKGAKILVGFALETDNLAANARQKLRAKKLDLIVATLMKSDSYPFGRAAMDAWILEAAGRLQRLGKINKPELARILLDRIEALVVY
ncbi:MAG: bifunctional 4'-phosphopantothenoylcysteine decarboxylase/phosphopantothenoylcysteine synthetase, partial [Candidatus Omnitrophica bacterium]|nr:bifunctional 4'-phosphopantothenoylcysteine decarboxylase/phosphopantothenoylcysteine synthetase [Candidatus Omnitrophota bacterium]